MMERLTRPEEKLLFALHRRAVRDQRGLFLAEGVRVVEELLDSSLQLELAVTSPDLDRTDRGRALTERVATRCPVRHATNTEIERVAATDTPQGIVVAARTPVVQLEGLQQHARSVVLVIDGVQDPGNFGTLIRCAEAFGVHLAIALTGTVDPWNPKCVRAAAGTAFRVPIVQEATAMALDWLEAGHFHVWAADASGEAAVQRERPERVALVAGNEGAGVSTEVLERATRRVSVPIRGNAESLNVAVATGILLYVLTRGD